MGSYSSVASLPAYFKMILGPPGCSTSRLAMPLSVQSRSAYQARILSHRMPCHGQ